MKRLFWKLFLLITLAFVAVDLGRSLALRLLYLPEQAITIGADGRSAFYLASLLIALGLSALLAWYLGQPIRILRHAFGALSEGKLDTRVRHLLGSRRDGLADLGRDFDGMAHRLQEQIAAQQRLMQEVSHELRSPLTRLQMAIGLAQQDPRKFHATLDRIELESLRLQTMLENMLALAQLEANDQNLPTEPYDPSELLAAVVRDVRFEAQAQRRTLIFNEGFCGGGGQLEAHAELLCRAFENVLRNAVKFSPPEGRVEVSASRDATHWQVVIGDRGPGVDAELLTLIFEPFYRVQEPRRGAPGFGLGLAIARRAIEWHGGAIFAANRPGGGLVMTMTLPLQAHAK